MFKKAYNIMCECESLFNCKGYIAGGCLLPHTTNDYDIFLTQTNPFTISQEILNYFKHDRFGFDCIRITKAYEEDENDRNVAVVKLFDSEKKSAIDAIMYPKAGGVDLIFVNRNYLIPSIDFVSYMEKTFPLSIQCVCMDRDYKVRSKYKISNVCYYNTNVLGYEKALNKYRSYYPDMVFKKSNTLDK